MEMGSRLYSEHESKHESDICSEEEKLKFCQHVLSVLRSKYETAEQIHGYSTALETQQYVKVLDIYGEAKKLGYTNINIIDALIRYLNATQEFFDMIHIESHFEFQRANPKIMPTLNTRREFIANPEGNRSLFCSYHLIAERLFL